MALCDHHQWHWAAGPCPIAQCSQRKLEQIWPYWEEVDKNNVPSTGPCLTSDCRGVAGEPWDGLREMETFFTLILLTWISQTEQAPLLSVIR